MSAPAGDLGVMRTCRAARLRLETIFHDSSQSIRSRLRLYVNNRIFADTDVDTVITQELVEVLEHLT